MRRLRQARPARAHEWDEPEEAGKDGVHRKQAPGSALYMAAVGTLRHDAECKDLYLRVTGQWKHAKVGLVAVINKLPRRIAAVVERGTPYLRA